MKKSHVDIGKLHEIVDNTIIILYRSKGDLTKVADDAKVIFNELEVEYNALKTKVHKIISDISFLENNLAKSRQSLDKIYSQPEAFTQVQIQKAYEDANGVRLELVLRRNEEQVLIKKRNNLEVQLKDTLKLLDKADKIIENINISLDLITRTLVGLSKQIEDIKMSQKIGIKIIKAQEEERKRVARELHDSPAQILSNVVMRAEICDKLMEKDVSKAKDEITKLKKTVSDCLEDVKRIVYDLRPLSLTEQGLITTLENFILEFAKDNKIEVKFKSTIVDAIENEEFSLTVFRVIQECLNNVKKHSGASKVNIFITNSQKSLEMVIADNGIGFDLEEIKNSSINLDHGFGLVSIKERLKLLDGILEIITAKGAGTKFIVKIPFKSKSTAIGGVQSEQ